MRTKKTIPAHHVVKGNLVMNPDSKEIINVLSVSVAGFKMIITGWTIDKRISSFSAYDVELIG